MKILEVTDVGFCMGGAETSVLFIRDELRRRGHDVKVLSTDIYGENMFSDYQFKRSLPDSFLIIFHHLFYFPSFRIMRKIIDDFHPDIIHFHTIGHYSPSVLFATKKIPSIMTIHGPEEFTSKLLPWLLPASDYNKDPFEIKNLKLAGALRFCYHRFIQRPVYYFGLRRAKTYIVASKFMARTVESDVPKEKIKLIYNGIELPAFKPLPDNQKILFVGRLEKVKGVDYLVRAFPEVVRNFPEAKLIIVGDGFYRKDLERLVDKLKLNGSVIFRGWIANRQAIINEYENAVSLVVPSIWPEPFGIVCIEALAVGRPVIVTNNGGMPELIKNGETGYVVPVKDARAISESIMKILADRELLSTMSETATKNAQAFGIGHFIDKIENLYKETIRENRQYRTDNEKNPLKALPR